MTKWQQNSLFCSTHQHQSWTGNRCCALGVKPPPPPRFCNPNSPCSFLKPACTKKKASIALRYRRLALVKAVSVSSSRAFFFLFLFAARLKTHARETKAMQTQSLGVAKRWKKKIHSARGRRKEDMDSYQTTRRARAVVADRSESLLRLAILCARYWACASYRGKSDDYFHATQRWTEKKPHTKTSIDRLLMTLTLIFGS